MPATSWAVLWLLWGAAGGEGRVAVVLRWQAVEGAVAYELEIAPDRTFARPILAERTLVPGYRWEAIPAERLYWRVRSLDAAGRHGPWSEVRAIEPALRPPELLAPAEGARFTLEARSPPPTFACRSGELFREYAVEVARDPGFAEIVAERRGPSPRLPLAIPGLGEFHWRMRATSIGGQETEPSATRRFTVSPGRPEALEPAPGARLAPGPIALRWRGPPAAGRWRVTVRAPGAAPRRLETAATEVRHEASGAGRYDWEVRALSPTGEPGAPAAGSFEVAPLRLAAPRPVSPAAGAEIADPGAALAISWEAVAGASAYEVQVGPPAALEGAPTRRTEGTAYQASGLSEGPLAWRARAIAAGSSGPWSPAQPFHLGRRPTSRAEIAADPPLLPADGASAATVSIRLLDAEGRLVRGAPLRATATSGRLEGLAEGEGGWVARFVAPDAPPASGYAEISVADRGFAASARVALRAPPSPLRLGVRLGWRPNLLSVSSPDLGADLTWRSPALGGRLLLSLRAGWETASATVPAGAGLAAPLPATAQVFPVSLLALYQIPFSWGSAYAGAGPSLAAARVAVGDPAEGTLAVGLDAAAGLERPLGPGALFVEAVGRIGGIDSDLARLRTGGLGLAGGYRVSL